MKSHQIRHEQSVLLLDMDNTLTDTRAWFADFILQATEEVSTLLKEEHRSFNQLFADVAQSTTLHEYAYVIEAIASKLKKHRSISHRSIERASRRFWQSFHHAHRQIKIYDGVHEVLASIRKRFPGLRLVILTDSPEWVTMERLALTGLMPLIDGVVAIRTDMPKLRNRGYQRGLKLRHDEIIERMSQIDRRHLQLQMAIPAAYAKPSSAGVELAARRLHAEDKLIIVGDKESKEGLAAENWRQNKVDKAQTECSLEQCSIDFIKADWGNHDLDHHRYRELQSHIPSLKAGSTPLDREVRIRSTAASLAQLPELIAEILYGQVQEAIAA